MANVAKKRILIVEDDPTVRELITRSLENAGYDVTEAEHALAGICAMVRTGANLVLVDIGMPIADGFTLVRELKAHADTRHVPVVVVTGMDTPECRAKALEAGCVGFIAKPMDMVQFPKQIAQFLC
ncbi:MAG TPA: response regulator [Candidatus Limnocylindria bacterium]|nr:response regulator [Candidatus Limnocylindria bacterium]